MRPRLTIAFGIAFLIPLLHSGAAAASQAAYRVDLRIESWTCRSKPAVRGSTLLVAGTRDEPAATRYIHFPEADPEDVLLPPIVDLTAGQGARTDTFPVRHVGLLHVAKYVRLHFDEAASQVTGTIEIRFRPEVAAAVPANRRAQAESLRTSACQARVSIAGVRSAAATTDPAHRERIWTLLKVHTDNVTSRNLDAAIPPLEQGLAIAGPHHAAFLWRLARAHFLAGEELPKTDKRGRLAAFQAGIDRARQALALDPKNGNAAFFLAANVGRWNTTQGFLESVKGLEAFEALCQKAIRFGSDYSLLGYTVAGDAHHALGQFYRLVPDSTLAAMLLGTRGDIDRSIKHHRLSLEQQPDRGDYLKELSVSLLCKFERDDDPAALAAARKHIDQDMATTTWAFPDPEQDRDHLKRLLAEPADACDYSRDKYL